MSSPSSATASSTSGGVRSPIIEFRDVSKVFTSRSGTTVAVDHVDLSIEEGVKMIMSGGVITPELMVHHRYVPIEDYVAPASEDEDI